MKTISIPEGLLKRLYSGDPSNHYVKFFGEEVPLTAWCQDIDPDILNQSSFVEITEICKDHFSLPLVVVENSADGTRSNAYTVYGEIRSTLHRILDQWYLKVIEFDALPVRTAEQLQSAIPVIDKYHIVNILQYKDFLVIIIPANVEPNSDEATLRVNRFIEDLADDLPMLSYRENIYHLCINSSGNPVYGKKMVGVDLNDGFGCKYYILNLAIFYSVKKPYSEKDLKELKAICQTIMKGDNIS